MERCGQAFRPGTRDNQRSHALLYVAFTIYFAFRDIPAAPKTLLCYAEFLLRSYRAPKSVTNALSSVRRLHIDLCADQSAFTSPLVERWRRALPLTIRDATEAAPPMPLPLLDKLCALAHDAGEEGRVVGALLAICFFTMARLSSLVPVSSGAFDGTRLPVCSDARREREGYLINLKWSKTRQTQATPDWVPLAPRNGFSACPVAAITGLLERVPKPPACAPLFALRGRSNVSSFRSLTGPMARAWLKALLWSLGQAGYTFHSLRRGACSLAFASGCELSDIKLHGGWRSEAVNLYFSHADARRRVANTLANPQPNNLA